MKCNCCLEGAYFSPSLTGGLDIRINFFLGAYPSRITVQVGRAERLLEWSTSIMERKTSYPCAGGM